MALYSPAATLHLPGNQTVQGNDAVLHHVAGWLAAFPDAQSFVDGVVWHADGEEYRSSLRSTFVGHNSGASAYGAATGRRVVLPMIVNARIRDAQFVEQWVEYDERDLIAQLGFDVQTILWSRHAATGSASHAAEPEHAAAGEDAPRSISDLPEGDSDLNGGDLVRVAVDALWNGRLVASVSRFYAQRYRAQINTRRMFGADEVRSHVLEMVAALPDLRVRVDDVICRAEPAGQFTSTRWTLLGTNTGPTRYAGPSNQSVRLTGITNHHVVNSRFQAGWTYFSELSLQHQLTSNWEAMVERACDG